MQSEQLNLKDTRLMEVMARLAAMVFKETTLTICNRHFYQLAATK